MNQPLVYHYTSIPTLALILKNRTIRFNSLRNVDDLQEKISAENKEYGKYCFVSSWTYEANESIPMWKMYSESMKGIRIGLPINPFQEYDDGYGGKTFISPPFRCQEYFIFPAYADLFFSRVVYSDEPDVLFCMVEDTEGIHFDPRSFSSKSKYWEFQKECRYKIFILPPVPEKGSGVNQNGLEYLQKIRTCPDLKFDYYDLSIKPDLFQQIQIVTGPAILPGSGEDIIVKMLAKEYGLTTPKQSCLLDKIRIQK